MTDEQIREAWAKACKSPTVSTNSDAAIEMVRAILAAGASEEQAEPIYQIRSTNSGTWHDVDNDRYYSTRFERRIVYTHDLNNRVLALEASEYLKDEEIAALRERIAGMEKDARDARLEALSDAIGEFSFGRTMPEVKMAIHALYQKEKQG